MTSNRKLPLFHAFVCLLLAGFAVVSAAKVQENVPQGSAHEMRYVAAPQIVEHLDEGILATLHGNTRAEARAEYDRGRVSPDLPMGDLILVLRRSLDQQKAFDAFVSSQYREHSPNFHHWLTPDQVGQNFGPAQSDIDTVTNWLLNHGFKIDEVSKDRLSIRFSGTASQVETAFHTEIHNLQVRGENHISNMADPRIPAALAPAVVGVKALHNFFPHPLHKVGGLARRNPHTGAWERVPARSSAPSSTPRAEFKSTGINPDFGINGGSGSSSFLLEDITPYDFATIYNVLPLWNAATPIDGTGQTIAIAGTSNINLADIATFRSAFGLPPNAPTVQTTNADPGNCATAATTCYSDLYENTLDVEWSGAIAKNASIVLVISNAPTATTDALYLSESYIVQKKTAQILNVSYGECEFGLGVAGNQQYNTLWQTAASEGIAVFVASGDQGSAVCDAGQSTTTPYVASSGLSVSGLASTPYNTAVGGTDFNWGSTAAPYWSTSNSANNSNAIGYIPEVPWNSTCTNPLATPYFSKYAQKLGLSPLTDAESACNFINNYYVYINNNYGDDLSVFLDVSGGSGGKSSCTDGDQKTLASCTTGYAKPTWQTGVTPSDGQRDLPDVSFFASSGFLGSSYLVCVSAGGNACTYSNTSEPTVQEVGGTSVASPIMAGVMALIDQKIGTSQGSPNARLYQLASQQSYANCKSETVNNSSSCIFNDIDSGTIAMPCQSGTPNCVVKVPADTVGVLSGYDASSGYDLATGLGSANVANLVNNFVTVAGPGVSFTAVSVTFPSTNVGVSSATQVVTLTNTGSLTLTISAITVTGTDSTSYSQTNTCGTSVSASASCIITVTFTPTAVGSLTAAISVADNVIGSPQTVSLSGTGFTVVVNPSFSLASTTPAAISKGSSAASTITVTPAGGYTGTVTLTCSVAPTTTDIPTCTGSSVTIAAGDSSKSGTVTVHTTAAVAALKQLEIQRQRWTGAGGAVLACLCLFGVPARQRKWDSMLGLLMVLGIFGALAGCSGGGGGGGTPTPKDPGTTAGNYTITVTGTDTANVTKTTTFVVAVN